MQPRPPTSELRFSTPPSTAVIAQPSLPSFSAPPQICCTPLQFVFLSFLQAFVPGIRTLIWRLVARHSILSFVPAPSNCGKTLRELCPRFNAPSFAPSPLIPLYQYARPCDRNPLDRRLGRAASDALDAPSFLKTSPRGSV